MLLWSKISNNSDHVCVLWLLSVLLLSFAFWKTDDANVLVGVGGILLTSTVLTGLETLTPSATSSYS